MTHRKPVAFDDLSSLVRADELLTTVQLAKRLQEAGLSPVAARQRISRSHHLWRSSKLQLPGRARLVASHGFVGTSGYLAALQRILSESRPALARCIEALTSRKVLLRRDAELILGTRSPRDYGNAVSALEEVHAARWEDRDTRLERLSLPYVDDTRAMAREAYLKVQTGIQLAAFVVEHLKRLCILSWRGTELPDARSGLVRFSDYPFTAYGWSFLRPLSRRNKAGKLAPAVAVLDVFADECELLDVDSHLARIDRIRAVSPRAKVVLGVVAAPGFSKDALRNARGAGLLVANLRQLFGDAALDMMAAVAPLLGPDETVGSATEVDEKIAVLNASLPGLSQHPLVADLRSLGLEAVGAVVARGEGWEDLRLGVHAPYQDTSREADIVAIRRGGTSVLVVECKALPRDKALPSADVVRFLSETVPSHLDRVRKRNEAVAECVAELWTTGRVDKDANDALARVPVDRTVKAAIRGRVDLLAMIPRPLERCRQLVETIASPLD